MRDVQRNKRNVPAQHERPTRASIIAALKGDQLSGMCRCPAHDDNKPSLSVSEGFDGKVLVKCHAGCSQERVISVLRARRLWPERAYKAAPAHNPDDEHRNVSEDQSHGRWRDAARKVLRSQWRDPDQELPREYLLGRGLTVEPPHCMRALSGDEIVLPVSHEDNGPGGCQSIFLTRRGDKLRKREVRSLGPIKGGYIILGELSEDADTPLIVAEGVETGLSASQLTGWPAVATCGTPGMSNVVLPRARYVIIAADNDEAGREAAAALANRLEAEGRSVLIVKPPYRDEDWNDVLVKDGKEAPDIWKQQLKKARKTKRVPPDRWYYVEDFMHLTFPRREMLLAPWLPSPGIAMVYAKQGHAKTFFALAVAFAVARGQSFLCWECKKPARVLYIDGEMPGAYLQERLALFGKPPGDTLAIVGYDTFNLRREAMPDLGTEEGRAIIDAIIAQVKPDLVILDSVTTLIRTGEEVSAEDWRPIDEWLRHHRWHGRTMLVVHHAGKSGDQRGTSKRLDTPETVIKLTKRRDDTNDNSESMFTLEFVKGRELYGLAEEPLTLRLSVEDGLAQWSFEHVRNEQKERVREMMNSRMRQREIAKELNISQQRVSQIAWEIKRELDRQKNVVEFSSRKRR